MGRRFFIVDVFAVEKYTGNQLAVVQDAVGLTAKAMQSIAREFNFSETTFITGTEPGGSFNVRIFTPNEELPFAGHPTLGTAYIIQREIIKKHIKRIDLNFKVGKIPVTISSANTLWMKQNKPEFGQTIEPVQLTKVLNIDSGDIDDRIPAMEVSTGLPCVIVALNTLQALKNCKVDKDRYFKLIKDLKAKAILAFCPEAVHKENHLHARFFADHYGIPEDPATGSAAGCLGAYLSKVKYFDGRFLNDHDLRIEQGYQLNRPSLLLVRAKQENGGTNIFVGGKVIMVAEGKLAV